MSARGMLYDAPVKKTCDAVFKDVSKLGSHLTFCYMVSSGRHVMLLSEQGIVYGYGSNDFNQLGTGRSCNETNVFEVLKPPQGRMVKQIALLNNGTIISFS